MHHYSLENPFQDCSNSYYSGIVDISCMFCFMGIPLLWSVPTYFHNGGYIYSYHNGSVD